MAFGLDYSSKEKEKRVLQTKQLQGGDFKNEQSKQVRFHSSFVFFQHDMMDLSGLFSQKTFSGVQMG